MFRSIRKLFGRTNRLEHLARAGDRKRFIDELGRADVHVLAALESEGLDPSATKEQVLAEIERAAKAASEPRDGHAPLVYERDGQRRLPFFTSMPYCEVFVGAYSKEHNRMYPFEFLQVPGALLARLLPACDVLVMNDRSDDAFILSDADAEALWQRWGDQGDT